MLVVKSYGSHGQLASLLRGTPVVSGATGTNALNNATFTDIDPNGVHAGAPFSGVSVGDIVHISGEAVSFTVVAVVSTTSIDLTPVIPTQHSGPGNLGMYRIFKPDAIALADIVVGPVPVTMHGGPGMLIYDEKSFKV